MNETLFDIWHFGKTLTEQGGQKEEAFRTGRNHLRPQSGAGKLKKTGAFINLLMSKSFLVSSVINKNVNGMKTWHGDNLGLCLLLVGGFFFFSV